MYNYTITVPFPWKILKLLGELTDQILVLK